MVERNLAKVEVESSRLFSRSKFKTGSLGFPFLSVAAIRDLAVMEIAAFKPLALAVAGAR